MDNFYKISALEVLQLNSKSGAVFTGRITFEQLLTIHRLTERKESTIDPFGERTNIIKIDDDEEFQRHLNTSKLSDLNKFLANEFKDETQNIIFPSSVILSLDLNENNSDNLTETEIDKFYEPDINSCFVVNNNGYSLIYIPKSKRICLIVDGQHRFYGLKKFYESTNDKILKKRILEFQFISTILLGYDSFQVAEVFANVNFNQKPVNKSLYYDIFGSAAKEKNEIQLAHFLALHMQNSLDSPLCDMIKLLGKGYGLFSQAFFVEKLLVHFVKNGIWNNLYYNYLNDGQEFLKIPVFLKEYFRAIEKCYDNCWPKKVEKDSELVYSAFSYNYILCKTTGMGAFFRLIKDIFPIVSDLKTENEIFNKCVSIFSQLSKEKANELFSKSGEYGQGGSEGFQIRLYKELKQTYKL
jgi:DGQHR domain-containing protein